MPAPHHSVFYRPDALPAAQPTSVIALKATLQHKINIKKPKPGLVVFYDIQPGNGAGLFSKEKIRKGGDT